MYIGAIPIRLAAIRQVLVAIHCKRSALWYYSAQRLRALIYFEGGCIFSDGLGDVKLLFTCEQIAAKINWYNQ